MKQNKHLILLAFLFFVLSASSEVKMPRIFSSNMVLQQGIEIPVWGWASANEKITVILTKTASREDSLTGAKVSMTSIVASAKTKTGENGKWMIKLPAQNYGGPFTLRIKGENTITFDNVMIGEVWVCSGQSNMEWSLRNTNNAEEEIKTATHPNIRLFTVPKRVEQSPKDDLEGGEWLECSPKTIPTFSAVAYLFGRELSDKLNVPIGLIHTSWGGTVAETWTSEQTIKNDPDLNEPLAKLQALDLDTYREEKIASLKKILGGEIPEKDLGMQNGKAVWAAPDFDDKDWGTIPTPGLWEEQGYTDIDGIAWYRTVVNLTADQIKKDLTLHLAKIDDSDIAFVNGSKVGQSLQYNTDRIYPVKKEYLKPGRNVISIRVEDTGGGGGIYGDARELYLTDGENQINIVGNWKFKISKATIGSFNIGPNSYPTLLYNGMINALIPYAIKGAIWYQGESNAGRAMQYRRVFKNLITDWRTHWGQGDFPFLYVSLANFRQPVDLPSESQWAELREAQTMTLRLPNTGMAMAIDIGEADDIHPRNKQDVGKRLALNAFKIAYQMDVVNSGPIYQSVEFADGKAIITFSETGTGLVAKDKYGYVNAFSLAGADRKFYWAKAKIIDGNKVEVSCHEVKNPVAVRFAWADNPDDLNLYNNEGLPAVPFRTDDWPGVTK
ncbi:sialate O-acetylesterase [Maribellus luteus]|uniref:Sialate O-acetylesterase n=1 Tax=Maribellus luteus TaxID=2305463 RepID=A0A399SZ67_9BACT|nr:sialate O-acetylesterase [Maribellus luteus]RIJ47655.1 sialate O-acetylesterase [Maribellus luteus]